MRTGRMAVMAALALVAAFIGLEISAQELKTEKLWELTGFDRPECALYDPARSLIYVSNVTGKPTDKDGTGFISQVSLDGKMIKLDWVSGLNAPKGMALKGDRLFVADIDRLVEIDVIEGKVLRDYPVAGAEFFNDVAVDPAGNLYVSDMNAQIIYKLAEGESELKKFAEGGALRYPNGLYVDGDYLIVASWGLQHGDASVYGHLKKVSLKTGKIVKVGSGSPIGHLDGIEGDGKGNYFVTDWKSGNLLLVKSSGEFSTLIEIKGNGADLDYIPDQGLLIIPIMNQNKIVAFKVE